MEIDIRHCNNIDSAKISISEGKLNIKFASNGTGKSSIAKAIKYKSLGDHEKLGDLRPFKHRDDLLGETYTQVDGVEGITKVMCFDEEYVNQFTFKPDELVSNSFDIFVRTDEYKILEQEIFNLVNTIKQTFVNNPELEILITNLKELGGAFTLSKNGLSKSSSGMKGLSKGNKLRHIPKGLESYQHFIQSEKIVSWIDWQTKGHKDFSELSDACPFCSTDSKERKEQISKVGQEYDKNIIKNLIVIIDVVDKLGDYFSDETRESLNTITSLKDCIEKEHESFIVNIKTQIDLLVDKLENLKALSGFHFKEGEKVVDKLPSYKLDLRFFSALNSIKTQESIEAINLSIEELSNQAGSLQGKVNSQRQKISKIIEKHQTDINSFLVNAGYRYKVKLAGEDGKSQLKLLHLDRNEYLNRGDQYLSFGERNAFSIVLFMYECLAKKPDLIILDDPISSFDKNKKYAILEMLFRRDADACLKGKTVLMLTHDVEPIIDTIKAVKKQFSNQVFASFLKLSSGLITENPIKYDDVKTFTRICDSVIDSNRDDIVKLIYLRRRCEILDDLGDAYQVLSNLFHLREVPTDSREPINENSESPEMNTVKFSNGGIVIRKDIPTFDYNIYLNKLLDREELKMLYRTALNGYEKLQIFRLFDFKQKNSIIQKFINETYHIENEFICQLDPTQFDLIPAYIIDECDKFLEGSEE